MQSIFRLAWCTDPSSDNKSEKTMFPKMRQPPVVDISLLGNLKRKRPDSPSSEPLTNMDYAKRRKLMDSDGGSSLPDGWQLDASMNDANTSHSRLLDSVKHTSQHSTVNAPPLTPNDSFVASGAIKAAPIPPTLAKPEQTLADSSKPETSDQVKQSQLQDVLEHQFNLEILLKHRELRLIEQELAKCQIALEQLRRCEVIPYPGATGLSESLSTGTGPALKPQSAFTQPEAPAPWGVTDGPYTRHYAKWLLKDPTFDSMPFSHVMPEIDSHGEGRSTRNSVAGVVKTNRSRSSRDSFGNLNQALPNYPIQTRGRQGPLVIRRLADSQFVKLICNNCQRGDFSSVQGFLNHCRIAHKVDYKSHEAAALACGKLLDDDESHLVPQGGVTANPTAPKPQQAFKPVPQQAILPPPAGFVHPLNAPVLPRYTWKRQAEEARTFASDAQIRRTAVNKAGLSSAAASFHASPLIGSSFAPYLSARFAKQGLGGDLQRATAQAREKIDLGTELAEEDKAAAESNETANLSGTSAVGVSRAVASPAHGGSQGHKGYYAPIPRPRPSPIMAHDVLETSEMMDSSQDANLSPHAADSNPGLVSDHEDDDATSDLDDVRSERHDSPDAVSRLGGLGGRSCGEGLDVDVEVDVDDEADEHSVLIRPRSLGFQIRSGGSSSRAK
jgi:ADA HAT complex component 1